MIITNNYSLKQIASIVDGRLEGEDAFVNKISIDSREKSEDGHCFFGVRGKNYNAEAFSHEAVLNGAVAVITSEKKSYGVSVIYVKNVNDALFKLAEYNARSSRIIGVTGSVGKTTVKDMIYVVLSQKYKVRATYQNQNNEFGVALTLLGITDEDYCVVEMGMRASGEIRLLSAISHPYIAVITNATTSHIELLGSKEKIFKAKMEILESTQAYSVVPNEEKFKNWDYKNIIPFFIENEKDIASKNIEIKENGIAFDVFENNLFSCHIKLNSFSLHDSTNALFAFKVGQLCGVEKECIKNGLEVFSKEKGRGCVHKIGEIFVIDDTYNASLESVASAIRSLSELSRLKNATPYIMLGDMLEVGEHSEEYHFRVGELAKDMGIKSVFAYGKFAKDVLDGFCGGKLINSYENAVDCILKCLKKGDILLVKASRNARFELIIKGLKERINEI